MAAGASGIKAGRAFVLIDAVDATGAVLNNVKRRFVSMGHELSNIGRGLFTKGVAAMLPVGLSLKIFSDFDDAMRKVAARSQGTGQELKDLRKQALDLGAATAFTSANVANLQATLAQKGFARGDILRMTPDILNLARAGGEGKDLNTDTVMSAELVSGILRAYQMEASESTAVADTMAVAINNSNYKLEDLIITMQYAAAAAKTFNMTLDETTALTAVLRDTNLDASIVGTAFRNMPTYMTKSKDRDRFNEQLQTLTGNTIDFIDEAGNLHKPTEILLAMGKAMKGLGSADVGEMFVDLFGTRAQIPAEIFSRSMGRFDEMMSYLMQKEGEAKRAHDEMEKGIGGAWRETESVIESVGLAIGLALDKPVTRVLKLFQEWGRTVITFVNENKGLVTTLVAAGVAAIALGAAFFALGGFLMFLTPILTFLGTVTWLVSIGLWAMFSAIMAIWPMMVTFALSIWNLWGAYFALNIMIWETIGSLIAFSGTVISAAIAALASLATLMGGWIPVLAVVALGLVALAGAAIAAYHGLIDLAKWGRAGIGGLGAGLSHSISEAKALLEQFGVWLYGHALEMGNTLGLTYRGFTSAIQNGNLEAAWSIATTGLKIIWLQMLDAMMEAWEKLPVAMLNVWMALQRSLQQGMRTMALEIAMSGMPKEAQAVVRKATGTKSIDEVMSEWVAGAVNGTDADKARNAEIKRMTEGLADMVKAEVDIAAAEQAGREADRKLADDLYKSNVDHLIKGGGAAIQVAPANEALYRGTSEAIKAVAENFNNADQETIRAAQEQVEHLRQIREFARSLRTIDQSLIEINAKEGV